jgi:flagellar biosynthesis component FlhA
MTLGSLALLEPRLGAVSNVGSLVLSIPAVIVCLRALTLYHRVRRRVNVVIQSYTYLLLSDLVLGVLYVFSSVHDLVVSDIGRGLNPWWCKVRQQTQPHL